jgi:signal transduction histidine kinase
MAQARWLFAPLLVAALAVSSLGFLAASWVSQSRLTRIDRAAQEIAGNAGPSIEHLAEMRGQLRRFGQALETGSRDARPALEQAQAAFARYRALPAFVGQEALTGRLAGALDQLAAGLEPSGAAPSSPEARAQLEAALDVADGEAMRMIDFNAEQSRSLARRIAATRRSAAHLSVVLHALAVLTTAFAALLALAAARRRREMIEEQRQLLARRAAELERFSARVAHDVLSPLAAVSLALEQWRRHASDDQARATSQRAQSALGRTQRIVDGLYQFASAGARPAPGAHCLVREVFDDVARAHAPAAEAAHAELTVVPAPPELALACSAGVLTSILSNLVGNAIKYLNEAAERRITVRCERAGRSLRVEVADTGPGLAPGSERLIFQPYARASYEQPGLGLGLATVKGMVEGHGGRVGVRSTVGRGCLFWFELPLIEG